ncbi:hypothetical protein D7X12_29480, partial [Corallococcus sicarius]
MNPRNLTVAAALSAALVGAPGFAQAPGAAGATGSNDRPDEDALFGGESDTPAQATPPSPSSGAQSPQERPGDDEVFGGEDAPPSGGAEARQPTSTEPSAPGSDRDTEALSGPATRSAFDSAEAVDDPLKIGGLFYLRANVVGTEGTSFGDTAVNAPTLVDAYFDARPTDRLRAFVVGRLTYDPT